MIQTFSLVEQRQFDTLMALADISMFFSIDDRKFIRKILRKRTHNKTYVLSKEQRESMAKIKARYLPIFERIKKEKK